MIFRNPQLLWLLLLLPAFLALWRWRGVRLAPAALVLRLLAVTSLVLALADPMLGAAPAPEGPLVVLADQSASLGEASRAALRDRAAQIAGESDSARVLYVGAEVLSGPQAEPPADGEVPALPDASASDLAAGLRAARSMLPGGGRVVLLSDGLATSGDTLEEARLAARAGLTIDVVPVTPPQAPEVAITGVSAPRSLRVGEEFPIEIGVRYSPGPDSAGEAMAGRLRLWDGDSLLGDQEVLLATGDGAYTFRHTAQAPGVVRLQAELELPDGGDTYLENNSGAATAVVNPPPRVLLVAVNDGDAALVGDALDRQGVETMRITPEALPTRLSELASYDGLVLVDVPAASLSLDQMAGVREFVRSEGRGLVAVGGRNSYTLGAYKDTPLEEVLPVMMEPPPRPQRTDIALLLIVDRSASMTAAFGVSKFDMAKEAAILATESLKPEDRIGILSFDTGTLWVVPFQLVGDGAGLATIQEQIGALPSGGGTDIEQALTAGLPSLAEQPASVRHAVLLTDGRSFSNNFGAYEQLVETARAAEISLSTIAIGEDSDTVLLEQLARWGNGRYYFADEPEDIPRLTLLESEIARSDPVVEGDLRANLNQAHPIVRDFSPAALPGLQGYVATTARDSAEVVLSAPEKDPLLAVWQYGLGRAVAWTPTAGEPWASEWTRWPDFERFWAQMVRYTLPEPDSGPLQVRVESRPDGARLVVDAIEPGGAPLDLATVNARVTLPDGEQRSFTVRQTAPGRYTQDLSLASPGAYMVSVVLLRDGGLQQRDVGYVQPVAPEYRQAASSEDGRALLEAIAEASGGQVLDDIAPSVDAAPAPAGASDGYWPWLLGLGLALWVLEIAVRRGVFIR
jgi:Ca-activated chloride channel family protein